MIPKNILFFFPYDEGPAGVNILFLRMADYLADDTDLKIHLVDYPNGYMISHNKNPKIGVLEFVPQQPLPIPYDSAVIFQTLPPWYIPNELKLREDTKLLFWTLHPYNLLMYFRLHRLRKPYYYSLGAVYLKHLMRRFTAILVQHRGIAFMDGENRKAAEEVIGTSIQKPVYVPVASGPVNRQAFKYFDSFAWLGRLADFKIPILFRTIEAAWRYSLEYKQKLNFHIIGDGPEREKVRKFAESLHSQYFEVQMVGEIEEREIEQQLASRASVLFAMGTSALEGARIGMPTILLDFSYNQVNSDYKYNYVFEACDYTLGREIGGDGYQPGSRSLEQVINELRDPDHYQRVSDRCCQYYSYNHDMAAVSHRLLEALRISELRYENITSLQNNIFMRAFKAVRGSKQF